MDASISHERFVNVVAHVDTATGEGKLLYVNPSRNAVVSEGGGSPDFELVVEDSAGAELLRVPAQVRISSCAGAGDSGGLVQQGVPFVAGARQIRLLYKGEETDRYVASEPRESVADLVLATTGGPTPRRRLVDLSADIEPQEGISYTIEARPAGTAAWLAISVGRATPAFELDRNQFPNVAELDVRVVRSTGFEAKVLAEERLTLND